MTDVGHIVVCYALLEFDRLYRDSETQTNGDLLDAIKRVQVQGQAKLERVARKVPSQDINTSVHLLIFNIDARIWCGSFQAN